MLFEVTVSVKARAQPLRKAPSCVTSNINLGFFRLQKQFGSTYVRRAASSHSERRLPASAHKQKFSSFDALIQESSLPVLVDFYAIWCGPCMMLGKVIDNVAPLLKDKVKFVKIDTDKYSNLAEKHNVHALPTLILFKNGKQVDRIEGYMTEVDLRLWLNRRL